MANEIVFKLFKTYAHPYLYDRHTNSLIRITEDEFNELTAVQKDELECTESHVVKKYQAQGVLTPNVVETIEHPASMILEQYMDTRMKQLTLQVTQQCNLRCEYCVYSGTYTHNRTHANKRMSFEIAKKAIEFFLERSWARSDVTIGFYGGEPLLEFELIKQCVEYTKAQVEGKHIKFNMTTNGTLLRDEVVDFLVEHDFMLGISLDGAKDEHDASRKFSNGEGSFETIIRNIERIKQRYPAYDAKISILTTINPHMDLGCVMEYFNTSDIMNDRLIMFNMMNTDGLEQEVVYEDKFHLIRNFEYIKAMLAMAGKLDRKYVSNLAIMSVSSLIKLRNGLRKRNELGSVAHHGGPCMPGPHRLFVRVDGSLFPCERVNESLDYYKLGNLDDGIDVDKARKILNVGQITDSECKKCWMLNNCSICIGQATFETEPTRHDKMRVCEIQAGNVATDLYEIAILGEFGFDGEGWGVS